MTFKKYEINIALRILLLIVTISTQAFLLVKGGWLYVFLVLLVILYQIWELLRFINKNNAELEQFVESIHYRDFSRHFDVKNAPEPVKDLRKGFNEINSTFRLISKEKEAQFLYLQKILELVDTGILSYETKSGEVLWMNDAFKKMMQIPYLKTIHSLEKRDEAMYQDVISLKLRDNKITSVTTDKNTTKILLSATAFQTDDKTYKLIAFQNINEVVDETEAQAWRKLLSVMTHEIMNSIAPISSLADTLNYRLAALSEQPTDGTKQISPYLLDDLRLGIETIQKRSEGLLKFAETYRNLNKITTLNLTKVYARDLFENLYQLMEPTLAEKNIELEIILKDPNLQLEADTNLIEQTLINLIVNAIDALKNKTDGKIQLSATTTAQQKVVLKVSDNGSGISEEVMDKIFIPFFSTRKNGSGIGLSLCKQIMMLHKGTIQVQTTEGVGTAFSLQF
jgi:nitrogen fixation/metabolism regulation signal transduction histidine kinase